MRITTSKSKNSESFYITHSFVNKQGKSTSKTFKKLGTLSELSKKLNTDRDGVMAWAKEQARIETEAYDRENETISIPLSPTQLIDKDKQRSFNVGYLFLQDICSSLKLKNTFRNISSRHNYEFNLQSIFSDLVYSRVLQPTSKKASYAFAQTLMEQPKYDVHHIYRSLSILAKESDYIQSELYKNSNFLHKRNTSVLYYDCTNYFFEIEQEDGMKKYGKSKENRPNPIVGMGLFMDSDGFPLAFDLYPGNQNEQTTLKPLEEKVIKDFDCSKFIFCSDGGLGSTKNKELNHQGDRAFVITKSLKKLKKAERDIALDHKQFRLVGSDKFIDLDSLDETESSVYNSVYYKEVPLDHSKIDEVVIVTYSPKYKAYQQSIRKAQLERAMKMIGEGGKPKKTKKNPNDPARFIKVTNTTEHGEVAEEAYCTLDLAAIAEEEKYDGFYAVSTDLEGDISEILKVNEQRWQIEECFRIMKTEFKARPVYLQREDRIKAHFLICFVALLIYRILEKKLNNKYTITEIINTLKLMNMHDLEGYGYTPTYTRTDLTDALHEVFGFQTDLQIVRKSKMRSIIKQTKQ